MKRRGSALINAMVILALVSAIGVWTLQQFVAWQQAYQTQQRYQDQRVKTAWAQWVAAHSAESAP